MKFSINTLVLLKSSLFECSYDISLVLRLLLLTVWLIYVMRTDKGLSQLDLLA